MRTYQDIYGIESLEIGKWEKSEYGGYWSKRVTIQGGRNLNGELIRYDLKLITNLNPQHNKGLIGE